MVGERELSFFPGIACGAVYSGFDYRSEKGAVAAALVLSDTNEEVLDYSNGGPLFLNPAGGIELHGLVGVEVLATYKEMPGAAAAVRCTVGQGVAVLSGTHPELGPHWLRPGTGRGGQEQASSPDALDIGTDIVNGEEGTEASQSISNSPGDEEREAYLAHVTRLYEALRTHQTLREEFLRRLLRAAGLPVVVPAV